MIVSPTPVTPSSVSTTTSPAVRSKRSVGTQKGSPVHGAVTRTVRTPVTRTGSARRVEDEVARHPGGIGDAAHPGLLGEPLAEVVEDTGDAIGASQRHPPQDRPGDEHGPRTKGERDQDIGPAPDATVEVDLRTTRAVNDAGQRVEGRDRACELAAAVVRD